MSQLCFTFRDKNTLRLFTWKNITILESKTLKHFEGKWIIAPWRWLDQSPVLLIVLLCRSMHRLLEPWSSPMPCFFLPSDSIYCSLLLDCKILTHISRNQCRHLMVQVTNILVLCVCEAAACKPEPGPDGAGEAIMISISFENPPWSGCFHSD